MRRSRWQRGLELLLLTAAATVGLIWALPAAGIGLFLGFCLLAQGIDDAPVRWLVNVLLGRPQEPRPSRRETEEPVRESGTTALLLHPIWIALIVGGCVAVAYLGGRDALHTGLPYIPAIVPFLALVYAIPGVVRGGPARPASR